jgi:hypothetical protein
MKKFIFLFLFLPVISRAQDCVLKNEKDRFNQDPRLTTGFKTLGAGSNTFKLSISADKKEIDFFIALDNSATCFNDLSRALITFDNKQRGSYKNGGTTNCKGFFHFVFPNQEKLNGNLVLLGDKKITTIQFTDAANKKEILTLRPEDQEEITHMTVCVLKELEKLRVDTWKPNQ